MESGHNSAERPCDAAPVVGERRAERQVNDDAPNRRFDPRSQLQQAQPQGADLGTPAPGPPGLEAQLLHQHIGGSTHRVSELAWSWSNRYSSAIAPEFLVLPKLTMNRQKDAESPWSWANISCLLFSR